MCICVSRSGCPVCGADIQIQITAVNDEPDIIACSSDQPTVSKLKSWAEDTILISTLPSNIKDPYWRGVRVAAKKFIQGLDELNKNNNHMNVKTTKKIKRITKKKAKK